MGVKVRHDIKVDEFPSFSSGVVYVAYCCCGKYESGEHAVRRWAENAGRDHKNAKEAAQ